MHFYFPAGVNSYCHSYERAFVDFFEDELVHHGYDWRAVTNEYLFSGKEPLFNCLISGRKLLKVLYISFRSFDCAKTLGQLAIR